MIPSDLVDVPSDYWATPHIKAALEARMIALKAENKFEPHIPLNRGELARLFAYLLTKSPEYNKAPLTGILVPVEGPFPEIERTSLSKKQTVTKEETIQPQDRVLTGPNSRAAITFDDGTTLQIEPNTRLIITQTEGKKYIKQDGTPGITVHKLLLNLEQGELYGGLAPKINTKEPFRSVKLEDPEQIEITLPEGVTPIQEGFFYCRVLAGQKVMVETRSKETIDPLLLTEDKVWSKPEIISWIKETEERIQAQAPVAFRAVDPIIKLPGEEPKEEETPLPRPDKTPTGSQEKVKTAYLTFDDGPSREITPLILNTAEKYGIKVTFFMLGRQVEKYPDIAKRAFEKGHAIGNHSYSHQYQQIYQNSESLMQEVNRCSDILYRVIGIRPQIFRAPGGSYPFLKSQHIERLTEAGFQYYDWNVSPGDATGSRKSASTLVHSVLTQAKNKDPIIVLMHDTKNKRSTAEALPLIIEGLQEMGYTFATITPETEPIQFTRKR
ncbi:MAG: polysaccharide deacetylase family protein [Syntrophomonadaceae bacterium]|nr:polysaccharide deacetylase family protein [Syntrophomonadaceae bacterium]